MHVIEQLLMLSRAGQALASGHYQTLSWHDVIDPLRQEMDELLALRQQHLIVSSTTIRTVQGDAILLRLMLRNLLENASRYSPEGSTITLLVEDEETGSQVSVHDEGSGIDASMVNDAIKAFRRMDRRYGGSGLGLNIVQRIVQIHRGHLSLTNRSDRSGLKASCWLPHQLD